MPLNQNVKGRINAFFSLKNFTDVITALPKPQTPMTDLLFPQGVRKLKTSPYIAVQDIENETGAVPVVIRGSKSYSVDGGVNGENVSRVIKTGVDVIVSGSAFFDGSLHWEKYRQ